MVVEESLKWLIRNWVLLCGVVWCGVVWCGVVWRGMVSKLPESDIAKFCDNQMTAGFRLVSN